MSENNVLTESERGAEGLRHSHARAEAWRGGEGLRINNFYPNSIVKLKDGSLLTATGQVSTDGGRTWSAPKPLVPEANSGLMGLIGLPDGGIGCWYADRIDMEAALGNATNHWLFRRSDDGGCTWGGPVTMTLDGYTSGLANTMLALHDGRLVLVAYSQFLSPFKFWGASWGTYRGLRVKTETEGHFGEMEASRAYYSDDCGRTWKASEGWVMGFREGYEKWVDSFVEPVAAETRDGGILMLGRSLIGRVLASVSRDRGALFSNAYRTDLMTSDSPGALARLPDGNLLYVWNQISREENRRGFRRSRLSSAVSFDGGATWRNFKNIHSIACLADRRFIPPDPALTPLAGDDDVGELPDDFELWHYPVINVIGGEVFLSYLIGRYEVCRLKAGEDPETVPGRDEFEFGADGSYPRWVGGAETLILPVGWFSEP